MIKLEKGMYGNYELPTFAIGCENPYIAGYDEKNNSFLISHNVSVSRWYPEDILRELLERLEVEDVDSAIKTLKTDLTKTSMETSEYPPYTEKCHFKCDTQFIKCSLCKT